MPANSLIIGVDLTPIKPIPKTITFQSDITTDKCRTTIRGHLKTWKADTVLHDGAPNVGTAWVQDAFSQAELVLQSMKLATDFLAPGGTFVTKVFRSKDYNALLWVFNQLFDKVEATKPPSSRNVSAEIFVVCRGFKAPKRIDPRFLDPRAVFAELSNPTPNNEAKVFNPEKKKRKREGYEEGDYIQFKEAPASEFVHTTDPIAMLGSLNRFTFEQPENGDIALSALDRLPETTEEIRRCCADLKVLGRKEFRTLLRWRLKARDIFGFSTKKSAKRDLQAEVTEITSLDEELKVHDDLSKLREKNMRLKKKERRRENERRQREIVRLQMHMQPPTEIGLEQSGPQGDDSMFSLGGAKKFTKTEALLSDKEPAHLSTPSGGDFSSTGSESDEEVNELDRSLDTLYRQYQERKSNFDAKYRAKKARKETDDGEWSGLSGDSDEYANENEMHEKDITSDHSSDYEEISGCSLADVGHLGPAHDLPTKRATTFFDQDIFKEIDGLDINDTPNCVVVENDGLDSLHGILKGTFHINDGVIEAGHLWSDNNKPYCQAEDYNVSIDSAVQDPGLVKTRIDEEWDIDSETRQDGQHSKFEEVCSLNPISQTDLRRY